MQALGGEKDVCGRWIVDAISFHQWYNRPCRESAAGGFDSHVIIEKILRAIQELSSQGGSVNFSLSRRAGKPNWRMRIYGPDRKEINISLATSDRKRARDIEAEVRSRLNQLALSGTIPYDTQRFLDEWLAVKENEISSGTRKRYQAVIDKAQPFLPAQLHLTTSMHIQRFRDWMARGGYETQSIILELNTLKQIFLKAHRFGYVRVNPVDGVDKPKRTQTTVVGYTDSELSAIFDELDRRTHEGFREQSTAAWRVYREIFYCMYYTGLRVGDAMRLEWDNVDHAIRAVLKACGLVKKSPLHSFRHTMAMRLLGAGLPIHEVANQLGDCISTIVTAYLKPQAPSQDSIDFAFRHPQGSRKGPANMQEMEGLAASGAGGATPSNTQITPQIQGFSDQSKNIIKL